MDKPKKQKFEYRLSFNYFKSEIVTAKNKADSFAEYFKEIGDSLNQKKLTIVRDILDDLVKNLEAVKIDSK